jgi:hypothetical protein
MKHLSTDDELQHLQMYGYKQHFLDRLVVLGRISQAATILCDEGRILEAACLLDQMSEPGRLEVNQSAELHLAYGFLEQCDDKESALLKVMSALQLLANIDQAEVKKAQNRLDDLKSARTNSIMKKIDCNLLVSDSDTEKSLLESNMNFEAHSKRLQSQLDKFEEIYRQGHLFALQVELELSLLTSIRQKRIERLRSVLASAVNSKCIFAECVARFELVLSNLHILDIDDILIEARHAFVLMNDVSKILLSASKRQESPEMLRIEQFFGLIRNHGIIRVSLARKAMLNRWFDVGVCILKDGLFVVSSERFKAALTQRLFEMSMQLLVIKWERLVIRQNLQHTSAVCADDLLRSMLQLWVADVGCSQLQQNSKLCILALNKNIGDLLNDTKDISQVFNATRRVEVCESIVGILCPAVDSITCIEDIPTIITLSSRYPAWKDEIQAAQSVFLKHIQILQQEWETKLLSEKSAADVSKILMLYKRTLNETFLKHKTHDLSANGSLGWHPPLIFGYNAFKNLGRAYTCRLKKHFLSEAKAMVQYLNVHIPFSIPMDSWIVIENIVSEVIWVLSLTGSRRCVQ